MSREKFGKGFIFTLDAFIALTLILFGIFTLLLLLNVQKTYYYSYEQTYKLAKDSLDALDSFEIRDAQSTDAYTTAVTYDKHELELQPEYGSRDLNNTPLEEIARLASLGETEDRTHAAEIADEFLEEIIPSQYCYRLDFFDLKKSKWVEIPTDRSAKCPRARLQAAVSRVVNGYTIYDESSGPAFDYGTCHGGKYPCGREQSLFVSGEMFGPTTIRLVVWI